MKTTHRIHFTSSASMGETGDESVDLVVTSPPYPMIAMWDESFGARDPDVAVALQAGDGPAAFEAMHSLLDAVWRECARVVRPGGFICINIGDATRTVDGSFRLYTNQSRVTSFFESLGFQSLPPVLWRKQTNAPNKFMGSVPSGAYITLEHEYILVLRKGDKRVFTGSEAEARRFSSFFWEERNVWFSDIWDFKGIRQVMAKSDGRSRSAAYPFELPYRLINMYSLYGDTVLDPFLGTGTTSAACVVSARNSIGYEMMGDLQEVIALTLNRAAEAANQLLRERIQRHLHFVDERRETRGTPPGYASEAYGFPVMTRQEVQMRLYRLDRFSQAGAGSYVGEYSPAEPGSFPPSVVETDAKSFPGDDQLGFSFTK